MRAATAGASLAAAATLDACGALRAFAPAAPQASSAAPVALTVWYPVSYRSTPPFPRLVREALRAAAHQAGGNYSFQFATGLASAEASHWFPRTTFGQSTTSSPAANASSTGISPLTNPPPVQIVDDPSLPMPDLIIAPHHDIDGYLAARALDLSPYVQEFASTLHSIPAALLRQGRAYAPGQAGHPQAALPLLRVPLVCAVPKTTSTMVGGQAWTAEAFAAQLQSAAARFVAPNGPLAYVPLAGATPPFGPAPVPGGLVSAAAVGYGTQWAQTNATSCTASFTTPQAQAALQEIMGWVAYSAVYGSCRGNHLPPRGFTFFMGPLGEALGLRAPVPRIPPKVRARLGAFLPPAMPLPTAISSITWKVAPLPTFPSRPAVPTDNLDVMVWKDTAHRTEASKLATALLSSAAQTALMGWGRGLSAVPSLALHQLAQYTGPAEAAVIASPDQDVTLQDAFGVEADANAAAYDLVRQNLGQALQSVAGTSGGFATPNTCTAPSSGLNAAHGPWLLAVTEAQVASGSNTSFAATYGGA